ncbi:transposase [Acidovorax sp.]|uniref:transposase n=1 Tax=Acidovorax sp. TaxID=1872122 RepID=UPI00391FC893
MKSLPIDAPILPTPGKYRFNGARELDGKLVIEAESIELHTRCPHCGSKDVRSWSSNVLVFQDIPYRKKKVQISIKGIRQRCHDCKKTFMQPLPGMSQKRHMTERLLRHIAEEGARRPFTPVAEEIGIAETTVRHVFADFVAEMEEKVHIKTPRWLAMTEVILAERKVPRLLVLNAEAWTVVDLLESPNAARVGAFLGSLRSPETVKLVGIGLDVSYPDLVAQHLAGATVFVDKAHVLARFVEAGLAAVKHLRSQMSLYERRKFDDRQILLTIDGEMPGEIRPQFGERLERYPLLKNLRSGAEALHAVYDKPMKGKDAIAAMGSVFTSLDPEVREHFSGLEALMLQLLPQVQAYFDHRCASASIAALGDLSDLGQVIDHAGHGRAFEALRAQLLYPKYFPAFSVAVTGPGIAGLRSRFRSETQTPA